MAYTGIVRCVDAGEAKSIKRMVENVAGVVDWFLFLNLGGRGKPMKGIKQEDDRVRSLF